MGIKFYDSNGKYWGEYDEARNLFIPFKKRTMRDCYNCKRYEAEGECIECHFEPKDEPTISKMEQVDKDINVRSKDEPTTQTETQNSNLTFEKDECAKEYEELGLKELKELIDADRKTEPTISKMEQVEGEPQTERYCTNCKHNGVIADYECRECCGMDHHEFIEQTDCAWK